MKIKFFYIIFFVLLSIQNVLAQENEELKVTTEEVSVKKKKQKKNKIRPYEPLAPAKAAFYSAVLPGLGQAYTKKYWKVPIVYAALGTGVYFYIQNNDNYNRVRDIYKRRLAGFTDDEFPNITNDQLISLQERYRREKELSLLVTVGIYLLNIVDANVTAHLMQYNVTEDLSFKPKINFNEFNTNTSLNYGVSLNYSF
ncbi:DUF5683 domain-containing protein [Aquimarina sediminis]|uniref:DUF5683 domain-containing protein n=1 Tax=Aquimarina sediminis TaxID=2070536 RepID=UPI0029371DAF|nr:DUF5683 domain-containing protein [Aquimarina sediminis]